MSSRPVPFYFGPTSGLFGTLHVPDARATIGIVLCPPLLGELIHHHRAYFRLACLFGEIGLPVLRFDYTGTGDSAGGLASASIQVWVDDVGHAIVELVRRTDVDRVVLCGARFGAILAARAAETAVAVDSLVLWDPILRGADWLDELVGHHGRELGRFADPPLLDRGGSGGDHDVLGFQVPSALWAQFGEATIAWERLAPTTRMLILAGEDCLDDVSRAIPRRMTRVWRERSDPPQDWLVPDAGIYDVLVPAADLRRMRDWVRKFVA